MMCIVYCAPRVFTGVFIEDVVGWVDFYDRGSVRKNWDTVVMLRNVLFYLTDFAKKWLMNNQHEMVTYEYLSLPMREVLGRPQDH